MSAETVTASRPANQTSDQHEQRHALERQPPVQFGDRSQQKPGHHRRQKAVEHFMDMPIDRAETLSKWRARH